MPINYQCNLILLAGCIEPKSPCCIFYGMSLHDGTYISVLGLRVSVKRVVCASRQGPRGSLKVSGLNEAAPAGRLRV